MDLPDLFCDIGAQIAGLGWVFPPAIRRSRMDRLDAASYFQPLLGFESLSGIP